MPTSDPMAHPPDQSPGSFTYEELKLSHKASHAYQVSASVYADFLHAFKDTSPIHVDDALARDRGFEGKIMHGTILNGFISHFIGVHFPGKNSLLQSVNIQYKSPTFLNDKIQIEGVITQKIDSVKVIVLELVLTNLSKNKVAAKAKVQVGLS